MENVNPLRESSLMMTRRQLFGRTALGLGTAAMAQLLGPGIRASDDGLVASDSTDVGMHHPAKAKRVIYLLQSGAPSQMD